MKTLILLLFSLILCNPDSTYTGHTRALSQNVRNLTQDIIYFTAQVNTLWPKELRRLKFYGLRDGLNVADIGCGSGIFSLKLLNHFPNMKVTCIDIDREFTEYVKMKYEKYIQDGRLKVVRASIFELPFENDTFDFAISRLIFQHLQKQGILNPRVQAAMEVNRILKPGGTFVVMDSDAAFQWDVVPDFPEYNFLLASFEKERRERQLPDSYPKTGRHLYEYLVKAGFVNVDEDAIISNSRAFKEGDFDEFSPLVDPYNYYNLVKGGIISQSEFDSVYEAYRNKFLKNEKRGIITTVFVASGKKYNPNMESIEQDMDWLTTQIKV